jgi:DeoR family transcriptional regulator, fructose operon transcriptional repressor
MDVPSSAKAKIIYSLYFTGGELRMPKESLVGDFAINNLNTVSRQQSVFLDVLVFQLEVDFTTAVLQEVAINEIMLKNTVGLKFVLADTNKVGREHSFISGSVSDLNYLITDTQANEVEVKALRSAGMKVIQVPLD